MTPAEWLLSGDTCTCSMAICAVMLGSQIHSPLDSDLLPRDPDDFGRCYRLLRHFPEWRSRLDEVAARFPPWKPVVHAWDELTALFEQTSNGSGYFRRGNVMAAQILYLRLSALEAEGRQAAV